MKTVAVFVILALAINLLATFFVTSERMDQTSAALAASCYDQLLSLEAGEPADIRGIGSNTIRKLKGNEYLELRYLMLNDQCKVYQKAFDRVKNIR